MMMRCEFKEEEGGEEEQRERERERENNDENNNNNNNLLLLVRDPRHAVLGRLFCHILKLERAVYRVLHLRIFTYISHQILYCNNIYTTRRHDAWKRVDATKQTPLYYVYFRSERWAGVL